MTEMTEDKREEENSDAEYQEVDPVKDAVRHWSRIIQARLASLYLGLLASVIPDLREEELEQPADQDSELAHEEILRMWKEGKTEKEIGNIVNLSAGRVGNIIIELRRNYGERIVPYHQRPRHAKSRDKSRDSVP